MNIEFKTMFNVIYGRLFGDFQALTTEIHPDILKIIKVTHGKTLDGKMFSLKLENGVDIYIIKELNSFIYMNSLFVDNKRSVVCSIPYDLYNYDQKEIVKIIKSLYTYICNQLITKPGDTLYNKITSIAPTILTFHTLRHVCEDLEIVDFIDNDDNFKEITVEVLYDSLDYSINELLDYCGIFAICTEKIEKEVNDEDKDD